MSMLCQLEGAARAQARIELQMPQLASMDGEGERHLTGGDGQLCGREKNMQSAPCQAMTTWGPWLVSKRVA